MKVGAGADARAIYEVSGLALKDASAYFGRLTLEGQKLAIAEKIVKEILSQLSPENVGDLPAPDRSRTLSAAT